jgi:hypothetical protein
MVPDEYGGPGVEPATPHRGRRPGRWTWRLLPLLAVLVVAGALGGAMPVQARSSDSPATPAAAMSGGVPMTLDCAHLSSRARAYADAHGFCTNAGKGSGTGVNPNYSVPANGNCGLTCIDMFQFVKPGWAYFHLQALSYWGPIVGVSYNIQTVNNTTGYIGGLKSFSLNGPPYPDWSTFPFPVLTLAGRVTATLSGTVTLVWGGVCVINNPYAVETIH